MTGFGKFGNVLENPTTKIVRALPEMCPSGATWELKHTEIVTVSIEECDAAMERIYAKVREVLDEAEHHVVLNFGVATSRRTFDLEDTGRNIADFRIPDEGGNQPLNQCIDTTKTIEHTMLCALNLAKVSESMRSMRYPCAISSDAGEYICNYTYYRNLQRSGTMCTEKCTDTVKSLFCHVPSFQTISEEQQKAFAVDLLD